MANVLFIKANDRPSEQAISVQMYDTFLSTYRAANPQGLITEVDLFHVDLPYFGNKALTGIYMLNQGMEPTPDVKKIAEIANFYLEQFLAADKIVFAFPMWNFTVPAPLITYLSYLSQAGKTFKYTAEGPIGLAADKKVVLLNARGGDYSTEYMMPVEMAAKLVQASIGLWGITEPELVVIEGHAQYPDKKEIIIETGLLATRELAASF